MKLIVGLGNPGREYAGTRHNAGFEVADRLAARHGVTLAASRLYRAEYARGRIGGDLVAIARPQSYMNLSGPVVLKLLRDLEMGPEGLLVITDDFALDLGRLRLRERGSHGGHNGLRSITQSLGTEAFARLRVGIGPLPWGDGPGGDPADFVLSRFSRADLEVIAEAYERAADAAEVWVRDGAVSAMDRYN
jgi:PTH1 family peptidyl-tRNA hydrolase